MARDSMALAIRRLMKRFMMTSSALNGMAFRNSALGMAPDDVANSDPFRDQAELEEAIGDSLLDIDDLVCHRADRKRRAVGRDGLHFQRNTGHRGKRIGYRVAVRFRPPRSFRKARDDVAGMLDIAVRKI